MKKPFLLIVTVFLFVFVCSPCFALYNRQGVPDSSEVRVGLVQNWFTAPVEQVRANTTELHINNLGTVFQVRAEENKTDLIIVVAPQEKLKVDIYSEAGKQASFVDVYPVDAPGSWVLIRDINTGKPIHIRYYFVADSDIYVQFSPSGAKTIADFIIFGSYAAKGVPVGIPFERLYSLSFSDMQNLTKRTLPWEYTSIMPGLYHPILQMVAVIRENQMRFFEEKDAAYNEDGMPVYISSNTGRYVADEIIQADGLTLSSAGFLKWIVDGLVIPMAGSYTKIEPLLVPTVEYKQGSFSDVLSKETNISFTLDWTRNLAAAALSVAAGKNYYFYNSGCDVIIEPFASEQTEHGFANSLGYLKDSGYKVDSIKPLMYVLAASEPGRFFLGAIKKKQENSSNGPEINLFQECVAFFPYFDTTGRFNVVVFENGKELTLDAFIKKYSGSYVHLTRINASERFFPQ